VTTQTETPAKTKPTVKQYAKAAYKTLSPSAIGAIATYVIHLAAAWLISWALRHGISVEVGYVPLSFLTFFGGGMARNLIEGFAKSWHAGATHGQHEARSSLLKQALMKDPALLGKLAGNLAASAGKAGKFETGQYL
jgi:hypothetical protein